ncbi:Uncharacterised protein [Sphingomonas paucimobilis]|nr:Uncharacterised protein [Sphingomonas paucimobilis]
MTRVTPPPATPASRANRLDKGGAAGGLGQLRIGYARIGDGLGQASKGVARRRMERGGGKGGGQ